MRPSYLYNDPHRTIGARTRAGRSAAAGSNAFAVVIGSSVLLIHVLALAHVPSASASASVPASASASASPSTTSTTTATAKSRDTFSIDMGDPRVRAVFEEIDRKIIASLEDIVQGLQLSRQALADLQQRQQHEEDPQGAQAQQQQHQQRQQHQQQLQNSIFRALDKVETVLHGHASSSSSMKKKMNAPYTYDNADVDPLAAAEGENNWVAISMAPNTNRTAYAQYI